MSTQNNQSQCTQSRRMPQTESVLHSYGQPPAVFHQITKSFCPRNLAPRTITQWHPFHPLITHCVSFGRKYFNIWLPLCDSLHSLTRTGIFLPDLVSWSPPPKWTSRFNPDPRVPLAAEKPTTAVVGLLKKRSAPIIFGLEQAVARNWTWKRSAPPGTCQAKRDQGKRIRGRQRVRSSDDIKKFVRIKWSRLAQDSVNRRPSRSGQKNRLIRWRCYL